MTKAQIDQLWVLIVECKEAALQRASGVAADDLAQSKLDTFIKSLKSSGTKQPIQTSSRWQELSSIPSDKSVLLKIVGHSHTWFILGWKSLKDGALRVGNNPNQTSDSIYDPKFPWAGRWLSTSWTEIPE